MKERKCNFWIDGDNKNCNETVFIILRVQVFHPDSLRKSWQKWYMCKHHYQKFIETNGKDWFSRYKNGKSPSPLIQYNIF